MNRPDQKPVKCRRHFDELLPFPPWQIGSFCLFPSHWMPRRRDIGQPPFLIACAAKDGNRAIWRLLAVGAGWRC